MAQDRRSSFRDTQKHMAGETETMKSECDSQKLELRDPRRDAWELEKYVSKFMEDEDELRFEAEKHLAQYKECGTLANELNDLKQKYKNMTQERNHLLSEVRIMAENRDIIKMDRDTIELEINNLETQHENSALLEGQLNKERVQSDYIAKDREAFELKSRRSGANFEAMSKVMETLKVEAEELRVQCKQYALLQNQLNTAQQQWENVQKERIAFVLRAQQLAESRETMKVESDALKCETENLKAKIKETDLLQEQLNTAKRLCDNMKREGDHLKLQAQRAAGNRKAMTEDIHTLKLEIEKLRAQCKNNAVLEQQLQTVKHQFENIKKERNAFILKAQRTAADREAVRKERNHVKLVLDDLRAQRYVAAQQGQQLNVVREHYDNIGKDIDSFILELQHTGTDTESTEEDLDDVARLEDQLNVVREHYDNIAKWRPFNSRSSTHGNV
ncbi:MAR-binding filament-like protein 1-1 [Cryptotermes secundus]|uniref:MAR-binding filament-like protein 1-1 n=1 Tax=Cryptotermes secundus TaxID=105785 RepID=UPI000CD7D6EE|nr:MAR-binding filament-like protein 1-1 [Cryptotermes secundus]